MAATIDVNGIAINHEVLGSDGPWVALAPGGRRAMEAVRSLANRIAAAGFRVLLHDRRNCGASDISFDGDGAEHEIWADDLARLLVLRNAAPAYIGGSSSGCRMSIALALRHPHAVRGLLLWRVTGGEGGAQRLAADYYPPYITAAQTGGMAAVCDTEHFRERIAERPGNRERLLAIDPVRFIAVMRRWNDEFLRGGSQPVIGASEADLRGIRVPAIVIPGNDNNHPRVVGENLSRLLPRCELRYLITKQYDLPVSPREEWDAREDELAAFFTEFMRRADERQPAST